MKNKTLITAIVGCLFSASAFAMERFHGLEDGSDENLKSVCKDYMVNSYLKNDPALFFYLLPESVKNMEDKIEKSWFEDHTKKFGDEPITEYEFLEISNNIEKDAYKGKATKTIRLEFKAGEMDKSKRSFCYFKQSENGRWYLGQKP
ncbi:hypothetical protein [Pseudoalteromonas distincta]|uniref:hypothetical protein n=1 Tax=Pseudoalteromonas distincta TaxID=77608 RepID=UPI00186A4E00|nr:hypothetical protein [Pseudoalteromonas distincta]MBE3674041.1 hypothetical protein [Pseudoalteromonas distincta KMM 3548]